MYIVIMTSVTDPSDNVASVFSNVDDKNQYIKDMETFMDLEGSAQYVVKEHEVSTLNLNCVVQTYSD